MIDAEGERIINEFPLGIVATITEGGMPMSSRIAPVMRLTGGRFLMLWRMNGGMNPNIRESIRMPMRGAWPASLKMLRISPTLYGSESTRWKQLPSSP